METITLDNDILVFYVTANSYPDGIQNAHDRLRTLVPFSANRKYFGLSRPENNSAIVYKAATEEMYEGESKKLNCESLTIKKGEYVSLTINNFREDVTSIGKVFQKLLKQPGLDPQGYCVEWYMNDGMSVKCMIRLKDKP